MSQHWRTNRQAVGGNQPGGSPHGSKYALPANSILSTRPPFELSEIREPSFDELELGACFLFFAILLLPALIVGAVVVGYLTFIA